MQIGPGASLSQLVAQISAQRSGAAPPSQPASPETAGRPAAARDARAVLPMPAGPADGAKPRNLPRGSLVNIVV